MRRPLALLPVLALCGATLFAARPTHAESQVQLDVDRSVSQEEFIASGGRCGTLDDAPTGILRAPVKLPQSEVEAVRAIRIPVAFHVIYSQITRNGRTTIVGNISKSQIEAQIAVLNDALASQKISFTLASLDRTLNNRWFAMSMGSSAEREAKKALASDPAHKLNIYTASPGSNWLGWCYYPWAAGETNIIHGVVLLYSTLPGGSAAPYNKGDTATHEVGHYLGLFHTFEGGCYGQGDYIADTPSEASPAYGCPTNRNSCPAPGLDPVRNYMDYTDDACMNEFTSKQSARIQWAVTTYKPGLLANAPFLAGDAPGAPAVGRMALPTFEGVTPNPFNPTTTIEFSLPGAAHVHLGVYDVAGRHVATLVDGERPAGRQSVIFEGHGLSSGVYMAVLRAGGSELTQRLLLLK